MKYTQNWAQNIAKGGKVENSVHITCAVYLN